MGRGGQENWGKKKDKKCDRSRSSTFGGIPSRTWAPGERLGTLGLAGDWDLLPEKKGQDKGELQLCQGRFRLDFGEIPPRKGLAQGESGIFLAGSDNKALMQNPFEAGPV